MATDKERVFGLISSGFPQPDDLPEIGGPCPANFDEIMMQVAAHEAVNVNDKMFRDNMRMFVTQNLLLGSQLTIAERAWLIFVLSRIDDAPHLGKGAPIRIAERAMFRMRLASFVVGDERSSPDRKVTDRLRAAAEALSASYEKVRAAYYSKDFRAMCNRLEERGIIDRVLNGKTVAN